MIGFRISNPMNGFITIQPFNIYTDIWPGINTLNVTAPIFLYFIFKKYYALFVVKYE